VAILTGMASRGAVRRLVIVLVATVMVAAGCRNVAGLGPAHERPVPLLSHSGRWITDAGGRVVTLHGFNYVKKWPPSKPEENGFSEDDADLLASNGFNTVRLGVPLEFLMPQPGQIDHDYLESIAKTVALLGRYGIFVLLDFHQDGYGPAVHGNGMPAWATLTDGLPNPNEPFPIYYLTNPALQRAFDNFWANKPGPDGVPLQTHYATAMKTVAARFVRTPNVIGYEAMNEPWSGTEWESCLTGCPDLEQERLVPFYQRMTAAVREVDRRRPVYVEPFTLFNFGNADTSLPGAGSPNVLSTHVYAQDSEHNGLVMDRSVAAATRDGTGVITTEWGDSNDPAFLTPFADQFDDRLMSWLYWSYDGHVVADSRQPLVAPNLNVTVLAALSRPYPSAVNGTPTDFSFDATTNTARLAYATTRPDGRPAPRFLTTQVILPKLRFPTGYTVTGSGADVVSKRCAPTLALRTRAGVQSVSVTVTPSNTCH
jgi:endoglycosylceramidase